MIDFIIDIYISTEIGKSIRSEYSLFLADYPSDRFVKFLFCNSN